MKNIIQIYLILLVGATQCLASQFVHVNAPINDPYSLNNNEKIVEISAKLVHQKIYFKLLMQNEEIQSVYSLVRIDPNGEFESVGIKYGHVNTINQPLWYSFVENELPNTDCTYQLIRISKETEIMKVWNYCSEQQELCEVSQDFVVENKMTEPSFSSANTKK